MKFAFLVCSCIRAVFSFKKNKNLFHKKNKVASPKYFLERYSSLNLICMFSHSMFGRSWWIWTEDSFLFHLPFNLSRGWGKGCSRYISQMICLINQPCSIDERISVGSWLGKGEAASNKMLEKKKRTSERSSSAENSV